MNLNDQKSEAKSNINSGRMLVLFTALPLIGSLIKKFYITQDMLINNENPIIELLSSFPDINTNKLFVLDNFIILGLLIGLFMGIGTIKKGISKIIELEKK